MVRLNLVNYVRAEAGFPKATRLTDTGREMVCALLAQEADRAVAALGKLDAVTVPTFRAALVYAFAVRGDGSTLIQPDRPLKSVKTEEESKRQENGRGESNITHDFARNRCTDSLDSIGPSQAPQKTEAADQSDHHGQDADIRGRDST
jgi:hypothetical protein